MHSDSAADLAVIQQYVNQLGVAALAEQIRAHGDAVPQSGDPRARAIEYRAPVPVPRQRHYREATVRPVPIEDARSGRSRWPLTGVQWAIIAAVAAATMGVIWAVIWIAESLLSAVASGLQAVTAAGPGILGIGALVALVLLLKSRGGGGRTVSGTWNGTIE